MEFLIIEGPAGSGKSYASRFLAERNDHFHQASDPDYIQLFRPRSYEGSWGIELSLIKDLLYLTIGVADYLMTGRVQIIDRCLLSQLVYGSIRAGHLFINPINTSLMLISADEIVRSVMLNLKSRYFDDEEKIKYHRNLEHIMFKFVILLPSLELLVENRELSKKEYPFEPVVELTRYKGLSSTLMMIAQDFLAPMDQSTRSIVQLKLIEAGFKNHEQLNDILKKIDPLH